MRSAPYPWVLGYSLSLPAGRFRAMRGLQTGAPRAPKTVLGSPVCSFVGDATFRSPTVEEPASVIAAYVRHPLSYTCPPHNNHFFSNRHGQVKQENKQKNTLEKCCCDTSPHCPQTTATCTSLTINPGTSNSERPAPPSRGSLCGRSTADSAGA